MRRLLALVIAAVATLVPVAAARGASTGLPASGTLHGTVVSVGPAEITVRTHARTLAVPAALTAAADAVAAADVPYVWGGGHAQAGVPSRGIPGGPGGGGSQVGFDCSGSVAAVLAGAGLWPAGSGVPGDVGLIAALRSERLLARGAGTGPVSVTLWDDPGTHIFLEIGTGFFGTSDGAGPSVTDPAGGPGWLQDGAPDTLSGAYIPWHLVPAALAARVPYGTTTTLGLQATAAPQAAQVAIGERVAIAFVTHAHAPVATAVAGSSSPPA